MDKVKEFYHDVHMREAVQESLIQLLRQHTANDAFAGKNVDHAYNTKQFIDNYFKELDHQYGREVIKEKDSSPR